MEHSIYIAQRGATWDRIAFETYGDAFLMDDIINANPSLSSILVFEGGESVKVPVRQSDPVIRVQTPWTQGTTVRIATWG